jgi:hypothetical protein
MHPLQKEMFEVFERLEQAKRQQAKTVVTGSAPSPSPLEATAADVSTALTTATVAAPERKQGTLTSFQRFLVHVRHHPLYNELLDC